MVVVFVNKLLSDLFGAGKLMVSDHMVRKTAHFLEYFVLSFLLFKAYLNTEKLAKTFYLTTITSVAYAISDEIHQYFIPGRAMKVTDVLIDTGGILLAALILLARSKRRTT